MGKESNDRQGVCQCKNLLPRKVLGKVMYQNAMTRNIGYVKKMEEMKNKLAKAVMQMTEAEQADHKYVNSTTDANKKMMEAMIQMMFEQQKQLPLIMEKFSLVQGMGTEENKHLPMQRSAPGARRKQIRGCLSFGMIPRILMSIQSGTLRRWRKGSQEERHPKPDGAVNSSE